MNHERRWAPSFYPYNHSSNKKFSIYSLLLGGVAFLAALVGTSAVTSAQGSTIKACLVQTIDTSRWSPPSPDPAGITLLPNGHLLVSDSEVEEFSHPYFHGVNLYEALTSGTLLATASTLAFTKEPTGVTINPTNGHLFFSDDDRLKIFEVDLGPDGVYGTADDKVTSFSTAAFTDNDPEGVAFDFSLTNGGPKSVTQGSAASNTIRATLVSGTTQSVSFSTSGLPAGATAAFSPTACSPTCSTTFTISTTTSTPPGTYTITVLATKGGISKATSFSLTVTAPGSTITTTSFQDGVFPSSLYFGTRDTRLSRTAPAQNFGAESTLWIDGDSRSPALLRWKGMIIPVGSTVKAATITLNVTNPTNGTYNLYALKRDWWEDQSNWNSYGPGYNWEIAGAQGTSDRGTTVVGTITAPSLGKHTITLNAAGIALVQSWVNSPSTNNGIIIDNPTVTDEMAFDSRNAATANNRPKLTVTYVAP